ncbi:WAT1-related protein At5g40240-like [Cynara cardunculus var. scolymus]|uniref:WAT1-related protein At5g40240-like n=1 Tax=Cynara cardunculus var. scolymus TaxID=59895 RepID=UPI000D6309B2|nr:WAT1-related protein At5g40240-like [Cynara cardunculus var. scolymus]
MDDFCLLQVLEYVGVSYSSPTIGKCYRNLTPVNTFLLVVVLRMEKIDVKSPSSRAKLLGTIIAISGAMVFTLYQGPEILTITRSPKTPDRLLLSQLSNSVFGGLLLIITGICGAIWNVLQTTTRREYPNQVTFVFFYYLFGTIQCVALAVFLEPNPSSWALQLGIGMIAVVFGSGSACPHLKSCQLAFSEHGLHVVGRAHEFEPDDLACRVVLA